MHRSLASIAAATAALLALSAAPAFAGAAENAFLSKLAGNWSGSGRITGSQPSAVSCKLQLKPSGARLNFTGRCDALDLGAQSFSGSLTYNDAAKRYEARSSSGGTAIGVKKGNAVSFTTKMRTIAGSGTTVMNLTTSRIGIDFSLTSPDGGTSKSHITFVK
jgi:hypothetical protein